MVNEHLLRNRIKEKGLKLKFIAEKLNITPYGLSLKLSSVSEFTVNEVYILSEVLELGEDGLNSEIFLPNSDT